MIVNPAKLGMVMKFVNDAVGKMTNFDKYGKDREKYKKMVMDEYLLATECEEYLKNDGKEFKFN